MNEVFISLLQLSRCAKIIEKHFTIDKGMDGNDHKVSLLPGVSEMVLQIRSTEEAMGAVQ